MNNTIMENVDRINEIGGKIFDLNKVISGDEASGGNANDYRDQRNQLIDELSGYVDISTKEDVFGNMLVSVENVPFVTVGESWSLDVTQAEDFSQMINPYWPHLSDAGPPAITHELFNSDSPIGPQYDNNKGELKGLILSRGTRTSNYTDMTDQATYQDEVEPSLIMSVQAQFDNLVHGVVTTINDALSPVDSGTGQMAADAPYGLNGEQGIELFTRKYMDRYDGSGNYNAEDPSNEYSLYSATNIEINADILVDYNKLTISADQGFAGDSSVVESILSAWQEPFSALEPGTSGEYNFVDYYNGFVSNLGNRGQSINNQVSNQEVLTNQIDNQRSQLTGVSTDEELGNMMKYQHAYNASARVVSVVNDMIGRIIDQTGVVGR